jgi:hypothetical protein
MGAHGEFTETLSSKRSPYAKSRNTVSAIAARDVLFDEVPIQSYKIPIAAPIIMLVLLLLRPLFMFAPARPAAPPEILGYPFL